MQCIFSRSAWSLMLMASVGFSTTGCSTVSERVAGWIPNPKKDREIRYNLARLREKDGQLAKARDEYLSLYEKSPNEACIPHRLAIVSARMGEDADARKYFELATQLEPNNAEIWADYGYMHLEARQYPEAEAALNQAIRVQPAHARALSNLALCYGYQDRMDESFAAFRRAGSDAEAHANVAYVYLQQGKPDLATRHYSRALTLDPSIKPAGHALLQLAELNRGSEAKNPTDALSTPDSMIAKSDTTKASSPVESLETTRPVEHTDLSEFSAKRSEPATPKSPVADVVEVAEQERSVLPVDTTSAAVQKELVPAVQHAVDTKSLAEESHPLHGSRLVRLCPEARGEVLQLVMALETDDKQSLKRSIHRLGQMGSAASAATPALHEILRHDDDYVQIHSALALWRINQSADEIVPTLVVALGGDDAAVSTFAAAALGEVGSHSAEVLPALNRALIDQDGYRRLHIAEALGRSEQWKPHAAGVLAECLRDSDVNVRWLATYSLADMSPSDPKIIKALIVSLSDEEPRVQAGAVWALERIGPASRPAIPQLKSLGQMSTDPDVKAAVDQCLSAIDNGSR